MCQGGIWREATRALIERAQGRASSYETRDIGAIDPGSWHDWHFAWKIGAMSFEKVTVFFAACADAAPGSASNALAARAPIPKWSFNPAITGLLSNMKVTVVADELVEREFKFRNG
jgi:hypothetical protein